MRLALEELRKSLDYHERQIKENLREIERKEESIRMFVEKNLKHKQTAEEIEQAIEKLKG